MTVWVTSDLHFGHQNVIKYCPATRGHYKDANHMNSDMIFQWNNKVQPGDLVYILGDVAFMSASKAAALLGTLNGDKILIEGNHDQKALMENTFRSAFKEVYKYLEIQHEGTKIVMCHYPIFDHNGAGRGSIMLHGHRHGNPHNIPGRIMDVGIDATGEIVSDLDRVVKKLSQVPHMYHHD